MSTLTSGKLKCMLYIYIYFFLFVCFVFFFAKQVKRIMSWTDKLKQDFEHNKNFRVWSLTGQGFLKAPSAERSGTGGERSSNTKILLIVLAHVQCPLQAEDRGSEDLSPYIVELSNSV